MDPLREPIECRPGDTVFGTDEGKIGTVKAFDSRILTVEHGLVRKSYYYVPVAVVNACNEGRVYLNVTKEDAEHQGWDVPPPVASAAGDSPVL